MMRLSPRIKRGRRSRIEGDREEGGVDPEVGVEEEEGSEADAAEGVDVGSDSIKGRE